MRFEARGRSVAARSAKMRQSPRACLRAYEMPRTNDRSFKIMSLVSVKKLRGHAISLPQR